ncbi:hypothetical protein [Christiangramia sabulilitoris]|uniref:Polymer-forming cytoskeletal protein n=1 Tax=Christiangramia sabulilitoris TaxID=2583991 RepID=A0A550I945_9FLAO|nr:hypothetical protein [Christiangramia sabulilitoris]TRO67489.1 hypothetical protein FGM01_06280 [Christiangramia sabulilitoris]
MKKNLLILSLSLGLAFTGCQSDATAEDPQEVVEIQNSLKEKKHDPNKLHIPMRNEPEDGLSANLHLPQFFKGALADCDTYHHYDGGDSIMVLEETPQSYHGEVSVNNIELNDQLNICGTVETSEDVKINYAGVFNFGGEMHVKGDVTVLYGGHFVIEGDVLIEGDLTLGKGATLQFLGEESSLQVNGKSKVHKKAIIQGTFEDVSNIIKK